MIVGTVLHKFVTTVIMTAMVTGDALKSDTCPHILRGSQAVNYVSGNQLCLLPIELMKCLNCKQEFILNGGKRQIVKHPTEESKKVLNWFMAEAEAERKRLESPIIKPETTIVS